MIEPYINYLPIQYVRSALNDIKEAWISAILSVYWNTSIGMKLFILGVLALAAAKPNGKYTNYLLFIKYKILNYAP